ncbi:hypothetical protein ACH5RR_032564 [Cinchona calisaya]|uniref:Uncharacterized protein n=1 Tax=Cinchona calisaya TaxID=153742 RepID=A0ABD2YMV5_9GENT
MLYFPLSISWLSMILRRRTISHFSGLVDKFKNKLSGWKHKLLSPEGRLILNKHVLYSIPTHILVVVEPPKGVLANLNARCENFSGGFFLLWRRHWRNWKDICFHTDENGPSVRSFADGTLSLSFKLWWNFHTSSFLWATFMHRRYGSGSSIMLHLVGNECLKFEAWRI